MPRPEAQVRTGARSRVGANVANDTRRSPARAVGQRQGLGGRRQPERHDGLAVAPSESGVPLAITRPRAITTTRSASAWASSM